MGVDVDIPRLLDVVREIGKGVRLVSFGGERMVDEKEDGASVFGRFNNQNGRVSKSQFPNLKMSLFTPSVSFRQQHFLTCVFTWT